MLLKERHPRVVLAHQIVIYSFRLSLRLLVVVSVALFNKLNRNLAEKQPANLDVVFISTIRID